MTSLAQSISAPAFVHMSGHRTTSVALVLLEDLRRATHDHLTLQFQNRMASSPSGSLWAGSYIETGPLHRDTPSRRPYCTQI